MIKYNFTKMSREQLAKIAENAINALADKRNFDVFTLIAENAINALADKRNFDVFTFTLEVDGDESDIEIIKEA